MKCMRCGNDTHVYDTPRSVWITQNFCALCLLWLAHDWMKREGIECPIEMPDYPRQIDVPGTKVKKPVRKHRKS